MCIYIYIVRYATLKLPLALPSPLVPMRDIRVTVTAKTAPEPRVMAKFCVAKKDYAAIAPNLMLPQAKLRQAVWYENDQVEILIIISIVSTIIFDMRIFFRVDCLAGAGGDQQNRHWHRILLQRRGLVPQDGINSPERSPLPPPSSRPRAPGGPLPPSSGLSRTTRGSMISSLVWTPRFCFLRALCSPLHSPCSRPLRFQARALQCRGAQCPEGSRRSP